MTYYWFKKHQQQEFGGYVVMSQFNNHPATSWRLFGSKNQAKAYIKEAIADLKANGENAVFSRP